MSQEPVFSFSGCQHRQEYARQGDLYGQLVRDGIYLGPLHRAGPRKDVVFSLPEHEAAFQQSFLGTGHTDPC